MCSNVEADEKVVKKMLNTIKKKLLNRIDKCTIELVSND